MEYPIVIEYVREFENSIAVVRSHLDSVAVYNKIAADRGRGVPYFACPATQVDNLVAQIDWLAAQRANITILFVADLLKRRARLEPIDIELNL